MYLNSNVHVKRYCLSAEGIFLLEIFLILFRIIYLIYFQHFILLFYLACLLKLRLLVCSLKL